MQLPVDSNLALRELDELQRVIAATTGWLETLSSRQQELVQYLDATTRPAPIVAVTATRTIFRGFEYRGDVVTKWSGIDIHLELLRRLWNDFPELRDAMAAAMASRGTVRCYVAKNREELFPGKTTGWIQRYSVQLVDGWYADTHLNTERMKALLPAAVRTAGMRWGADVRVFWRRTILPLPRQ